ncbi:TRAP transporter large permease [Marinibaculum pumilum]|uniref:TRAP transporter large permease protein n=1 Tax=Marinibaculum pumilum TaxID=1766165 RepID=A0ABV7L3H2_9PROT
MTTALIAFAVMLALAFLGLPIAFALGIVGVVGFMTYTGVEPALYMIGPTIYDSFNNYPLSVIPLFILMGNLVSASGLSRELFRAANAFIGHFRGGLAGATILACGGFSAISGSSVATTATMSQIALPEMRAYNYSRRLAAGSVAAGGTLGIMIPPSIILVIYGIMTETEIGRLFIAGILPGLLALSLYLVAVFAVTAARPELGPAGPRHAWRDRLRALGQVWAVAVLFAIVIGGIYGGVFTPTEAAGIGACGAMYFFLRRSGFDLRGLARIATDTVVTSAMLFIIIVGAELFSNLISMSGLPNMLIDGIQAAGLAPYTVILLMLVIYFVMGMFLDSLGMILLTVPVFYPVISFLGFDLIWFGIIVVTVTEISLITPPIGMNIFIMRSMNRDLPLGTIYTGVLPFVAADVVRLAILTAFPVIALLLPSMMG